MSDSKIIILACLCAAALLGCPDGEGDGTPPETNTGVDGGDGGATGGTDGDQFVGCQSDADCGAALGDLGPCQTATCDAVTQNCKPLPVAKGTACDDGNPCTSNEQCDDGACQGAAKTCDDGNPCTNDFCDPATGQCSGQPNSALCDDGNLCTQNDQCANGACTGSANPTCQCVTDPDCAQFDDADVCNGVLECVDNQCLPKPDSTVTCPDSGDPCKVSACSPTTGECKTSPQPEDWPCNDADACTLNDACAAGVCTGDPMACTDDNPCTTDACDPGQGCIFPPNDGQGCDDSDLCTLDDACSGGACTGTLNPDCGCSGDADCVQFEDGDLCNGSLKCNAGACEIDEASVVDCTDEAAAAPACIVIACQPTTGSCKSTDALDGTDCDDSSACTKNDHCEAGSCVGAPIECTDDNGCTAEDCDPATGCTSAALEGQACDDLNSCTTGDACNAAGECAGSGDCACTVAADCAQFEDGDLCNGTLDCIDGNCVVGAGTVVDCQATGTCVEAICIAGTGECIQDPKADGAPCDDDDACTEASFCTAGSCGGDSVSCDDGNLCTDDNCDAGTGCVHSFNQGACDDGNECTESDICDAGSCGGTPVVGCGCDTDADCGEFEDDDPCNGTLVCAANKCVVNPETVVVCPPSDESGCTANVCNPTTGSCEENEAPDGKECNDDNACTVGDLCLGGTCTSDALIPCDDENPCTDDACEPEFGCVATPNVNSCDDGDDCTVGDTCSESVCIPGDENICGDTCNAAWTLGCGGFDTWNTGGFGSTKVVSSYSCSTDDFPGGEYTYLFEAPFDATITVTLSNEDTITDILILEQSADGCDPGACVATGFSSSTFEATAGTTYYLVVDGFLDAEGAYTINVECAPASEQSCTDGIDEDNDGSADCDDPDCALDPACLPAQCEPAWPLTCGSTDVWGNYLPGSTDVLTSYSGCGNPLFYWAPEYTYQFVSPVTGDVTVTLSEETAVTHINVLEAGLGGTCQSDTCVGWGGNEVTFAAVEGQTYFIVVDGVLFAEGTYQIDLACPTTDAPDTESSCTDGFDDDQDGLIDCQDDDCFGVDDSCQPACIPDTVSLATLECPTDQDNWNTANFGSNSVVTSYGCPGNSKDYAGPEYVYTYVAAADGPITIALSNEETDTDIIVMRDQGLGCNPASCETWAFGQVTFDAVAGETYYIAVDGTIEAGGSYELSFSCGQ
ncbi:MAG: hypothetical protein ACI9WU_001774 [Myxococcota bacterium]|jgi:hypothetical protein